MVDAIVSYAINKLDDFLVQQVNIKIGVKDAVIRLKNELCYLQVSVRALEEKQQTGHIRLWIDNVKDVANEAVIILERFGIHQEKHAAPKQGALDCLRSCICICKKEADLYNMAKEIESLEERFDDIKKRRDEYYINDMVNTQNMQQRKRTLLRATSFENEVDVVGFEDNFKTLLAGLDRDDPSLGMISIHGMGGLGKSTIASKLYHSNELSRFELRAWVCVSEDYNIKHVLKKIIKSFTGQDNDLLNMDEVDLRRHLRKLLLNGGPYLAVIDDIWDVEVWEKIKRTFPDKNNGSRVIITTRNQEVAEGVNDKCFVHKLRFLTEDESWKLFCKRTKPTKNLENLGKDMVSRCRGLPLAIVVLSGLLLHKKSYKDWSDVKDHLWRKLKGKSSEIKEILGLSYDDLSFHMRQCFLYIARFPEDHAFDVVDKLMQLWIAEEFIPQAGEGDGVVVEDVAKDYLNELINRNMIQIKGFLFGEEVDKCQVHDLVRDLAIQKATEQKLLGIFDSSILHTDFITLLQGQPRHAIYNGYGEYLELPGSRSDDLKLRSLALIYETDRRFKLEEMKLMYARFKYLKVLDFSSVEKSDGIAEEIGDLVLLKFLGLMGGGSRRQALVIPPNIGKLKRLQTLCGQFTTNYIFPSEMC